MLAQHFSIGFHQTMMHLEDHGTNESPHRRYCLASLSFAEKDFKVAPAD
jgi:hypothetical protein